MYLKSRFLVKKIFALLMILTIHEAIAIHFQYETAERSDQWIHDFFSEFLKEFEKEILTASRGENCSSPRQKLEIVKNEIDFYRIKGVESNASLAINEFLQFSKALENLCEAQKAIKIEKGMAIAKMKLSVAEMKDLLDRIDQIVLYNETNELRFNTTGVREAISELEKLLDFYQSHFELEGLWIFVSKSDPVLFEEIWIRIYAVNVTPTKLFIDQRALEPKDTIYSFDELGKHLIYVEGLKGSEVVRSNTVEVIVKKIPVYITLKANSPYIGMKAEVNGLIADYYGSKMSVPLTIKIDAQEFELNSSNGFFNFSFLRSYECRVSVSAIFEGNETHESAVETITIFFSRFPVWIKIKAEKERIFPWESAIIYVNASEELPIKVFFNEKAMDFFGKDFKFDVKLSPGKYRVYAYFAGDELRKEAKSNEIVIVVESLAIPLISDKFNPFLLLFLPLLTLALFLILRKKEPNKALKNELEGKTEEKEIKSVEIDELSKLSISEAYSRLFSILIEKFGLPKSLTPRELLKKLEGKEFVEKLNEITRIHEKHVYASQVISEAEIEKFFKLVAEVIESV